MFVKIKKGTCKNINQFILYRTIQENFLPGYVFLDTDQPGRVYQELKKVPGYGLLSGSDEFVAALGREEAD